MSENKQVDNYGIEIAPISELDEKTAQQERIIERRWKRKQIRKMFFPEWVVLVLLSAMWFFFLSPVLAVVVDNFFPGLTCGLSIVMATFLALMLYPTATAKWRTLVWAILLSEFMAALVTKVIPHVPGRIVWIVFPVLIFVSLRANMNYRRIKLLVDDVRAERAAKKHAKRMAG